MQNFSNWVIGVGASAGGLEALTAFMNNLSPEFKGTVIVAQHLAPHSKSMMVELLSRTTPIPVVQAENQMVLQPGKIYIVPPNYDLDLNNSRIILTEADSAIRPKPSIDEFFTSLAQNYGKNCVGIILSGTGTDGAKGIKAIKEAGGLTLAQDNQSAKYDGMPNAAIDTGKVDSILPPNVMAADIAKIILEHVSAQTFLGQSLDIQGLSPILKIIKEKLKQDFSQYKPSTIHRRIAKRMAYLNVKNYDEYATILKNTPGEVGEVAKELLISVTKFFRDPDVFEDLTIRLKAIIREFSINREFRGWVAGCATGEEAYTLAMILLDIQEQFHKPFPIKIFATDLDHDAIQVARLAIYDHKDMAHVPPRFVEKYFQANSIDTFELTKQVRDCVVFARQDLIQNPPFVKLDLVSCRNVMIYFEPELQRRVLEIFHYALVPSGLLVLGKSESILSTPLLFEILDKRTKVFERINISTQGIPLPKISRGTNVESAASSRSLPQLRPTLQEVGYRKLLKAANIAGVMVDSQANIIQVLGDVSPYFQLQDLKSDFRLTQLLHKSVSVEIPILIRKAEQDGEVHRSRTHIIGRGSQGLSYQVSVRPLNDSDDDDKMTKNFFLVSFIAKKKTKKLTQNEPPPDIVSSSRVAELEHELFLTKEHLQIVIEELGVSNEELQSLNEELSSTNEELQSTNEELETTNEELQSTNEELTTVNEEVVAKSNDLRNTSTSLENIQNSIGSPLIVLDSNLRLLLFNKDSRKIAYISEGDIGREFLKLSTRCEITEFEALARKTLKTGQSTETICESGDIVFQLKFMPYLDEKNNIIGVILVFSDTTERIRVQEKLAASEERTRAIIEASPSLICLKDHLGRYLLVNTAFKNFFNLTGDLIGKTDRELIPEHSALQLRDADLEVFMSRSSGRREHQILAPGERTRYLLANRFPIMDATGRNPKAVGTIAIDITPQVEAQEALKKSEARYRAIAEDQAVFVCRHDPKGDLTYINDAFVRYFGIPQSQILNRSFSEIVDLPDAESIDISIKKISSSQPIVQNEQRVSRRGNDLRWVRWIHKGIFDQDNELSEIQSVGFDVTEYRTQTDQLKQKEAMFTGIFDNTSDFITLFKLVDGNLVLESLNKSAEKSLGWNSNQLVGRRLEDFFSQGKVENAVQTYLRVIDSNKAEVFEEEVLLGSSARNFLTTLVPLPTVEGEPMRVAAVSRDITSYKVIERDLRDAKESAEVANKAKSDFLASMSHELRTPLNVVLGFCQMLEISQLDNEQINFVRGIHKSGQLLLNLIEDILDLSKIEAGKIKLESVSFSVRDFIYEIVDFFSAQAQEKGIMFSCVVMPSSDRNVIGDPNRLRQVMMNFLGNAMKFTSHGQVNIRVESEPASSADEMVFKFSVRDTGIGIRDVDKSKIFQKFSQAETGHARRFGGSGLGLAISKQLVNLMDGEISFESEFGQGSTFWFKVPLTLTNKPSVLKPMKNKMEPVLKPVADSKNLNILVVDDNKDSLVVAGLFLKRIGHSCELVSSGADALKEIKNKNFDLVLMDMQMPEMDGCQTTRYIRERGITIPIIALTANALTEDVERCYASGMNDYLSKPVLIEDLNQMLTKWSDRIERTTHEH